MRTGPAGSRAAIEDALLAYHRSPGKHALIRRQPAVLFSSIKEVLQLASGRSPDGDEADAPPVPVRDAARFFIRTAMLYPDADHYALLGVDRAPDPAVVKDRYRLMMRLMHPDFANALSGADWPADAATRVNRAYEVLSSPVRKRAYDEQIVAPVPARPVYPPQHPKAARAPTAAKAQAQDPRRHLKGLATAFGMAGGIAVIGAWLAAGQPDRETLVQRSPPPSDTARPAAPAETIVATLAAPAAAPDMPPPASAPPAPVAQPPVASPAPAIAKAPEAVPAPAAMPAPPPNVARAHTVPASVALPPPPASRAAAPAPAPVIAFSPLPVPNAVPAPVASAPAVPVPSPAPRPVAAPARASGSPTMAEVHPLLTQLLQRLESGWGDRVLGLLDRESRAAPGAQALLEKYNNLVDGMRPIKLSNAQFNTAESREGRLLVTGRVLVHVRDNTVAPRELAVQAEFAARDGTVVLIRLAPGRD